MAVAAYEVKTPEEVAAEVHFVGKIVPALHIPVHVAGAFW